MNEKKKEELERVLREYGDRLYRTAWVMLGKPEDVQDVLQEVLIRYMEKAPVFRDGEHEKAWLLKVTSNLCRDFLRFRRRHSHLTLEQLSGVSARQEDRELLRLIVSLPPKYKMALLLFYVEGYHVREIARITGVAENTVKKRLQRGREMLRKLL